MGHGTAGRSRHWLARLLYGFARYVAAGLVASGCSYYPQAMTGGEPREPSRGQPGNPDAVLSAAELRAWTELISRLR